jgi:hypothetical protein
LLLEVRKRLVEPLVEVGDDIVNHLVIVCTGWEEDYTTDSVTVLSLRTYYNAKSLRITPQALF